MPAPADNDTRRLALGLAGFAVAMFGFGYLLVPLYDLFCELTGRNGRGSAQAATVSEAPQDRLVDVEFVAILPAGSAWEFRPATRRMQVQPGRLYDTSFFARNPGAVAARGRAVMSVAPMIAAKHVRKTECFCFTVQEFAAAEGRAMPMAFMLDPALATEVESVTLVYTFYEEPARDASPAAVASNEG